MSTEQPLSDRLLTILGNPYLIAYNKGDLPLLSCAVYGSDINQIAKNALSTHNYKKNII